MDSEQLVEIIGQLKERHESLIANFDQILSHQDATIQINDDFSIEKGTDKHKGFMAGIILAKSFVGEFPIDIKRNDEDADDEHE